MDHASQEGTGSRAIWLTWVVILAVLLLLPHPAAAQDQNQAGLVIRFPDGRVETMCIAFEGDTIAGDEILSRSGLDVVIDPSSGMGITVCQIEGQGCAYPVEACFCRCMGGESCGYWNYFYRDPGDDTWTYSALGALLRDVPPGGMEAWVWGDGSVPPAAELTFAAMCAIPTSTAEPTVQTPTATPTSTAAGTDTPAAPPTETPPVPPSTATQVVPQATNVLVTALTTVSTQHATAATPTTTTEDGAPSGGSSYWAFGMIVAALAAAGLVVLLRQRGGRRT